MSAALARLPAPQQRAIAVGLLVLVVALVVAAVAVPLVLMHGHYDEAISELSDRLQRYRRVSAQAPEYRRSLDGLRERDSRRFLLKNAAPNLAAAELQELVRAAVEGSGGRITTSQNQGPRDEGRFRQITVNVQFFATTGNLQKILYQLESQQPYLLIDNLTVRPINAFRGFKPPPGQEPEVNVQMDVTAFSVGEPDKGAAATRGPAPGSPPGATNGVKG